MSNVYDFIKEAKDAYYAGNPIISDDQYDALIDIYGETVVGAPEKDSVPHFNRMYSLQKYYRGEHDGNIAAKIAAFGEYVETPKLDGSAIAILYVHGKLKQVLTRGDGRRGKDITHLFARNYGMFPAEFPDFEEAPIVQICGEVVAPKSIPNARNFAAGAMNLKNPEELVDKPLFFYAYSIYPFLTELYVDDMFILNEAGFKTVMDGKLMKENFPTDGLVVRHGNNYVYERLGFTNHHPRGAFAIKERTEGVKTKILDVVWQTGKTGKVTPVAILEPVEIDGAQVSRATLNNPKFIDALGVRIGDDVMVERAGGIIPRIIRKAE